MDIETLNSKYSHAGYVSFKEGPGGFPIALITTPHATAAISPYGAHLLSYTFATDSQDLLFLSDNAVFKEGTAIRGGVPICWPWFGAHPAGGPDHGFARTRMWKVAYTLLTPKHECVIAFELTDTPETLAVWPHRFRVTLRLTVGKALTLELTTHNLGDTSFELTQALHTYFSIGNIAKIHITGLEASEYSDKTDGGTLKIKQEHITFCGETDRIYRSGGEVALHDDLNARTVRITAEGSRSTVIWNPWKTVCEQKPDLDSDDYTKMVCIETANAGNDRVILQPNESHTLKTTYSIKK